MNWYDSGPFTVFDLETPGLSPVRDRIIEIGAVRVELDGSVSRFQTLVNPGVPIHPRITAITGIDDDKHKVSLSIRALSEPAPAAKVVEPEDELPIEMDPLDSKDDDDDDGPADDGAFGDVDGGSADV